jgi:transcriptional regulator with XRE-family HTH domain
MSIKSIKNTVVLKALESLSGKRLTLGSLLGAIRQGEELSQAEFALKLGVSKQYLCDLERGRRFASPKAAATYAKNLGYSPQQFVRLCLQDLVNRDGINFEVEVKAA